MFKGLGFRGFGVSGLGVRDRDSSDIQGSGLRVSRFPSRPLMIRVPFLLLFGFNKETP